MRVEQHTHDFRSLALRAVALTSELENTLAAARLLRFEMLTHAKALRRVSSPIPEGAGNLCVPELQRLSFRLRRASKGAEEIARPVRDNAEGIPPIAVPLEEEQ